ncbi:hypothetical protein CDL15_Pgr006812 [Punica granatum]|uniref:Uncharacterized protein n=1 Tax=Punica granatum TaxID=22663 RepID=A0A218X8S2_PUNGR|nr:hypothetical protein CDL15_Pgr006812 [Punica granatum]
MANGYDPIFTIRLVLCRAVVGGQHSLNCPRRPHHTNDGASATHLESLSSGLMGYNHANHIPVSISIPKCA